MTGTACAFRVECALADQRGVISADADLRTGTVTATFVAEAINLDELQKAVNEAGYAARLPAVWQQEQWR
jgi:copper chaperone CopZ